MNDLSLRERIQKYFSKRPDLWVNGKDIEELAMQAGYKASNASRRLRELESGRLSDGKTIPRVLERRVAEKGARSVSYKWLNFA